MHKKLLLPLLLLFFTTGCSQKIVRQPYQYPNYSIIKPKITCNPKRENIQKLLHSYLGKPYVWAEEVPDAFDCSGLTYNIYGQMGIDIPRIASEQAKMGKCISFKDLQYGDLIFFTPSNKPNYPINHVGIYLEKGLFAHASSSSRKVTISDLTKEARYFRRLRTYRRYLSLDEKLKYTSCSIPLKKMKIVDMRYTTPWKTGMHLPKTAVP